MSRYQGSSHADLLSHLKKNGVLCDPRAYECMMVVDRGDYAKSEPYKDGPQGIGYNTTISAPHMHAQALINLKDHLVEGSRALDVGSGTGYLTACMAVMVVGESGTVIGVDHIPQLVQQSIETITKTQPGLVESGRIKIFEGDGRQGCLDWAPFNAIHVGAAAPEVPRALLSQLSCGGRIFMPVGPEGKQQYIEVIDKLEDGSIKRTKLMSVIYGSLRDKSAQWPN